MKSMVRKESLLLAAVPVILSFLVSCGGGGKGAGLSGGAVIDVPSGLAVKGDVRVAVADIPCGVFAMGVMDDGRLVTGSSGAHEVLLSGYAIAQQPVSQALWASLMGGNPSSTVSEALPVDRVSGADVRKFLKKLSAATGYECALPTEAQWEYAVKSGLVSGAPEGFREWTADSWSEAPATEITQDLMVDLDGDDKVTRTPKERSSASDFAKAGGLTFRFAIKTGKPVSDLITRNFVEQSPEREHVLEDEEFVVGGVKFGMVGVTGGKFSMGATAEQADYGAENERPVQEVEVEGFEIGRTEVTAALWKAVMGGLPVGNNEPEKPVVNVSWYRAQEFIMKLNELTGRKFRLPTEAEWEYAARGGASSGGYRYSGSNDVKAVASYKDNTGGKVTEVGLRLANELGIKDMSGNAWEWCQDWGHDYGTEPERSEWHVMRGGSAASGWSACRVSNRQMIPASNTKGTFGLRLAL